MVLVTVERMQHEDKRRVIERVQLEVYDEHQKHEAKDDTLWGGEQ